MAINKNFVVKHGLEVATKLVFADAVLDRVGVGTSSPGYTLDVIGNASIANDVLVGSSATIPTVKGTNLFYSNAYINKSLTTTAYVNTGLVTSISGTNLNYQGVSTFANNSDGRLDIGTGGTVFTAISSTGFIGIANSNPNQLLQINTNSNIISILSSGYVGLGSTVPASKFDVIGDAKLTGVITAVTHIGQVNAGFATIASLTGTGITITGVATFRNGPVLIGTATSTGTAGQILQVAGVSSGVYIGGLVGIASTNPQYRLDVITTIGARIGLVTSNVVVSSDLGRNIEIGLGQTTLATYLDFHGADDTYVNYATRLIRNPTANANFDIVNRGTGNIRFISSEAGNIDLLTNNILRGRVDSSGTYILGVGAGTSTGTANQLLQVGIDTTVNALGAYIAGDVGIGSTTPNAKLNVVPNSTAIAGLFSGTTSNDMVHITQLGSGNALRIDDSSSDASPFIIDGTGNAGVGTILAGAKLHVLPTTTSIAGLFSGTTSADMVRITQLGTGNALVVEDESNPDATPFVVNASGNVGIGTSSATAGYKLDVIGSGGARIGLLTSYVGIASDTGRSIEIGVGNSTLPTYLDFHGAYSLFPDYSARLINNAGSTGTFDIVVRGTGNLRFIASDAAAIDSFTNNILRGRITSDGTYLVGTGSSTGTANQVFQVAGFSSSAYIGGQLAIGNTIAGSRLYVVPSGSEIAGVFSGTTSADMVRITQMGSGNAFVIQDSADPDTSPFIINSVGQVLVGTTTAITMRGYSGYIQEHGIDDNTSRHQHARWSNDAAGPVHSFFKSRGATVGANGITTVGDSAGEINFLVNDGTDFVRVGIISAAVDGPVGVTSTPGRLVFYTTSGISSVPVEAMRINSGQVVLIGTATSTGTTGQVLQVAGVSSSAYIGGNLGLGNTNPVSKLEVTGNARFTGVVTANSFVGAGFSITGVTTFATLAGPVIIGGGTSTGTAEQVLQVTGVNSSVYVGGTVALGATIAGARLYVVPTLNSTQVAGIFSGSTSVDMVRITQTGSGNALVVEDSANPDATPFVITGIGNVGIGTTNPPEDLSIFASQPTILFTETDSGAAADNKTWIQTVNNQEFRWQALDDTAIGGGNIFKFTRNNNQIQTLEGLKSGVTWFEIDNQNQKVGIGSTQMATQLDVIGTLGARIGLTTSYVAIGSDLGRSIEIGIGNSTDATYLDFHGAFDTFSDYSTRLISNPGTSGNFDIVNRGTGNIRFISSDVGGIEYYTTNVLRGKITPQGTFLVGSGTSTGTANQVFQVTGITSDSYFGGTVAIGTVTAGARLHVTPSGSQIAGLFSGTTSADLVRITQFGSGNALVVEDEGNPENTPFVVNTLGNTGIGTNVVGAKLHVLPTTTGIAGLFSGTTSDDMVRITQLGSGNAFRVEDESNPDSTPFVIDNIGEVGINTLAPTQLLQIGAGTSAVVATGIGSVGIGTLNPSRPLQIQKDASATNLPQVVIQPLTGTNASGIQLQNNSVSNFNIGLLNSSGSIAGFTNASDPLSGFIGLSGTSHLLVATNNIERLRLDPQGIILIGVANSTGTANQLVQVGSSTTVRGAYVSGDIGVGVTNPGAKLHVVPNASAIAGLFSGTTSNDMVRITQLGSGNAILVEDAANPDTTPFVVTGIGSVGIGTLNPFAPLTVTDGNVGSAPNYSTDVASFLTNQNTYTQLNFTNISGGNAASGDLVVTADTGTDTTNYIDFGINNSGFTTTTQWSINGALDGYVYTSDGNLAIGAANAVTPKYVSIFTAGLDKTNERLRVTGTGLVGIANTNPQFQLDVAGDVRVQNENKMRFGGDSSTTNFYIQYNSTTNSLDFVVG